MSHSYSHEQVDVTPGVEGEHKSQVELKPGLVEKGELPADVENAYLDLLFDTMRNVANSPTGEGYTNLPMLLRDGFNQAYLYTDATKSGEGSTKKGKKIVYYQGQFAGIPVEFATRYKQTENGLLPIAWGMRKTIFDTDTVAYEARETAASMYPSDTGSFVLQALRGIQEIQETKEPELPRAA